MKKIPHIILLFACTLWLASCGQNDDDAKPTDKPATEEGQEEGYTLPEGYFVATFGMDETRVPITGSDNGRIQSLRYLVFTDAGTFVKEREIEKPATGFDWPLETIKDTLPNGDYRVVFLANAETTLTGYQAGYTSARLSLPDTGLTAATEYYMAKATFSDGAPNPSVILQRIIGAAQLHRNSVDAQEFLNKLIDNITDDYSSVISDQLTGAVGPGTLIGELTAALGVNLDGVLGQVVEALGVDALVNALVTPISDILLEPLLKNLIDQIGNTLAANTGHDTPLEAIGAILNPWELGEAQTVLLDMTDFPREINLDLDVTAKYEGLNQFLIDFEPGTPMDQKNVIIRGFGDTATWNINKINVRRGGLLPGLVVDQILEDGLLQGSFVDITDPISIPAAANLRYKANYSLIDLGMNAADPSNPNQLSLNIRLGDVANLDDAITDGLGLLFNIELVPAVEFGGIEITPAVTVGSLLSPVIDTVVGTLMTLLSDITITLPINVPLLDLSSLNVSGSWDTPTQF